MSTFLLWVVVAAGLLSLRKLRRHLEVTRMDPLRMAHQMA
jgi:hypothetical protein